MSISGIGGGATTTSQANKDQNIAALGSLAENYETFLTLLTAQLRNQDPLQPQDSSEFTKQLVSFSQVEQQIQTNRKLDSLNGTVKQGQASSALQFIGREVDLDNSRLPISAGGTTIGYVVDGDVSNITMKVFDNEGNLLTARALPAKQGQNRFTWDGEDQQGNPLAPGFYRVELGYSGAEGSSVMQNTRYAPYSGEPVKINFGIGDTFSDARLVVRDRTGAIVHSARVNSGIGNHSTTWDGMMLNGKPAPQGFYDFQVETAGGSANSLPPSVSVRSRVTGVDMSGGRTEIMVGNLPIPMDSVNSLYGS